MPGQFRQAPLALVEGLKQLAPQIIRIRSRHSMCAKNRQPYYTPSGEMLYSPDLNPIEKAWAKLKQLLRAAKARTKQALDQAIAQMLPLLTAEDAKAWFRLPFNALQQ
jgi:transposase